MASDSEIQNAKTILAQYLKENDGYFKILQNEMVKAFVKVMKANKLPIEENDIKAVFAATGLFLDQFIESTKAL